MKVGILTWHKAINHGAVLQTYASCQVLRELNCIPVVLEYDRHLRENDKEYQWTKLKDELKILLQ